MRRCLRIAGPNAQRCREGGPRISRIARIGSRRHIRVIRGQEVLDPARLSWDQGGQDAHATGEGPQSMIWRYSTAAAGRRAFILKRKMEPQIAQIIADTQAVLYKRRIHRQRESSYGSNLLGIWVICAICGQSSFLEPLERKPITFATMFVNMLRVSVAADAAFTAPRLTPWAEARGYYPSAAARRLVHLVSAWLGWVCGPR